MVRLFRVLCNRVKEYMKYILATEMTINRHECNAYGKENYYEESNISSYDSSMYVMYGDSM